MKSLILFDLHYQHREPVSRSKLDEILNIREDIDAVIYSKS